MFELNAYKMIKSAFLRFMVFTLLFILNFFLSERLEMLARSNCISCSVNYIARGCLWSFFFIRAVTVPRMLYTLFSAHISIKNEKILNILNKDIYIYIYIFGYCCKSLPVNTILNVKQNIFLPYLRNGRHMEIGCQEWNLFNSGHVWAVI